MLDYKTSALLKILNTRCDGNAFYVVSIKELLSDFPSHLSADEHLVRQCMLALSSMGYVIIKYDSDGEYCVALTVKGRFYSLDQGDKSYEKRPKIDLLPYILGFFERLFANLFSIFLAYLLIRAIGGLC